MKIVDGDVNDIRIVGMNFKLFGCHLDSNIFAFCKGILALVVMMIICAVGMEYEVKAQNVLVVIILAAMVNFLVGTILGPKSDEAIAQGFHGFSSKFTLCKPSSTD